MIDGWLDSQVTDMENDLILTARIKKMLEKEFDDQSEEYIEMIADENSFEELDMDLQTENPLDYKGYEEKIEKLQDKTGLR